MEKLKHSILPQKSWYLAIWTSSVKNEPFWKIKLISLIMRIINYKFRQSETGYLCGELRPRKLSNCSQILQITLI